MCVSSARGPDADRREKTYRGENRQAADCYRKVIAFVREHPDDYHPGFEDRSIEPPEKPPSS
jgi:hypothetical protein